MTIEILGIVLAVIEVGSPPLSAIVYTVGYFLTSVAIGTIGGLIGGLIGKSFV